ncbi:MAG: HAMP domain-containing protein [Ktedonobacteraceae bacterium]|nr:HAMP domain-containing protein [Ktedonobacteraceae bacterium]MBO0789859.1 HAMP domain-containing protein [Ktedonobacteraceae bacterium]
MQRFLRLLKNTVPFFRHLQWKLAFSYILVTAIALLITIAIAMDVITNQVLAQYPQTAFSVLREEAPIITGNLQGPRINQESLDDELSAIDYSVLSEHISGNTGMVLGFSSLSGYTVVTDLQGKILASSNTIAPMGAMLPALLPAEGMRVFLAARSGATNIGQTVVVTPQKILFAAKMLVTRKGRVVGILLTRQVLPGWHTILFAIFPLIYPTLILLVTVVGAVGVLYSVLMSRWLVGRFKRVTVVAEAWSKGDFSLMAKDNSGDELGLMAQQLNNMARKLEQLLREQQRLAVLEERNRLARDLHDSLKQQMFAIAMQIWSAQACLGQKLNVDAARERLEIIEHLLVQAQQELSSLIFQLRPIELEEKPFSKALEEYCQRWSQQQNIPLDMSIEEVLLPLKAEEALFRLVQEALTNIARHSGATMARLELGYTLDQIVLFISDNGQGFEPQNINRQGIGLLSMRERMEALGGSIKVESIPGEGTCITAYYETGPSNDR